MDRDLFAFVAFWVSGILFTGVELIRPARPIKYSAIIKNDLAALALYQLLFFPAALYVTNYLVKPQHLYFTEILSLPLAVRVALFYVLADLGSYWFHRLMHTKSFWRVHQWHHSPTYMYWLAGIRATFPQQVLFNLPVAFFWPLLYRAPYWLLLAVIAENFFRNNWMHMNVTWRSNRLEWIFVTPRYHHIHHSDNPSHQIANLGSLLTIWDRMFGTYVNPEEVDEISFGTREAPSPVRLVLGI